MDKNGKALSAIHELGTTKHKWRSEQAGRQRRLGSFAMVSSSYTNHLRIGDRRLNATPASNDIGKQASKARSSRTVHENS